MSEIELGAEQEVNREPLTDETESISLKAPLRYAVGGHDVREYPAGPCTVHPEAAAYAKAHKLTARKPSAEQ